MGRTELADLAKWAEAGLPRLIDEAADATVERVPFYRDKQLVPIEELRVAIEENLRFLIAAIGDPAAPLDLTVPEATGRRRARQGAPLPEVLQCYRICFTTLWDALVGHAPGGSHDTAGDPRRLPRSRRLGGTRGRGAVLPCEHGPLPAPAAPGPDGAFAFRPARHRRTGDRGVRHEIHWSAEQEPAKAVVRPLSTLAGCALCRLVIPRWPRPDAATSAPPTRRPGSACCAPPSTCGS